MPDQYRSQYWRCWGAHHVLVEFALPPFGYVLTLSGEPLDARPVDISWFLTRAVDDMQAIMLDQLPVLPTHLAYPGDYRSRNEIRRDFIENTLTAEGHASPADEARRMMQDGEGPAFFKARGKPWSFP